MKDIVTGDFQITMTELRAVARYVTEAAESLLPVFESAVPDDARPRAALEAARVFITGERRTRLQRLASLDAHRAAAAAPTRVAGLAGQAAGDAASAAYLHPISSARQVGHILRAAGNAALVAELLADGDREASAREVQRARRTATPDLVDVLRRYPLSSPGRSRASQLMHDLDRALRST